MSLTAREGVEQHRASPLPVLSFHLRGNVDVDLDVYIIMDVVVLQVHVRGRGDAGRLLRAAGLESSRDGLFAAVAALSDRPFCRQQRNQVRGGALGCQRHTACS